MGVFGTVTGRDEDLECGPVVGGKETVLSRDYETGRIDVLEAPEGTCQLPEIKLDPPSATNGVGEDHTVTATVASGTDPEVGVLVGFEVVSGPNVGEVSDPNTGECSVNDDCTTDASGKVSWKYAGAGGLGVDEIEACFTDVTGAERCVRVKKEWVDTTPPAARCVETVNPHGSNVPPAGKTTLPGPRGGDNEDGFYELLAKDNLPGLVSIFVTDAFGSGPFGPFLPGDKVKITEAPGGPASSKPMGSSNGQAGAIAAHINLLGDAIMNAVDAAGNVISISCLVPPPPK